MKKKSLFFLPGKYSLFPVRIRFVVTKRQKFVISVILLSLGLFLTEHLFGKSGFYFAIFLSILTGVLFYLSIKKDMQGNSSFYIFILPFFYTLAFGLFYFLIPARFLTRTLWTFLYAIGLYSLFLSQNIFVVASIRTIALLSGARITSFVITFLSFGLLSKVVFSLEWPLVLSFLVKPSLIFIFSFPLILQSIWTITLDKSLEKTFLWAFLLSVCLFEIAAVLWFWPTASTFIAIFLTGLFYTIVGISQVWFDKRLFKGVIWEYVWVAVVVMCMLIVFTSWKG